jgi:hypothetical protein
MSVKPLAEAYEKLKELRRQVDSGGDIALFLQDLEVASADAGPDGLIRMLEIKALASRVFGDPGKADIWLKRPSATLSGQRPVDLLRDELGTAVVREMLEQIDHGIFA